MTALQATAVTTGNRTILHPENVIIAGARDDDPACGCAVASLLCLALWALVTVLIWALTTL